MATYETSTIKIYTTLSETMKHFNASKLFCIDDIESMLNILVPVVFNNTQYIKNNLEISITLDTGQINSQPLHSANYVSIKNSLEPRTYYYFVKNAVWRSKSTVRYELVMDVLNTFKENSDYTFKPSSRIIREHKDRFTPKGEVILDYDIYITDYAGVYNVGDTLGMVQDGNLLFEVVALELSEYHVSLKVLNKTADEVEALLDETEPVLMSLDNDNWALVDISNIEVNINGVIYRNIDYVAENINPLLQCDSAQGIAVQHAKSKLEDDWYLLYRNSNDPTESLVNPVECYLIPAVSKSVVGTAITDGKITPASLNANYNYYIVINQGSSNKITLDDTTELVAPTTVGQYKIISFKKNADNTITLTSLYGYGTSGYGDVRTRYEGTYTVNYFILNNMPRSYYYSSNAMPSVDNFNTYYSTITAYSTDTFSNSQNIETINGIEDLDRTQAKNIKLIKLPYSPYNFTITSNKINISNDSNWDLANFENIIALKLNNLNLKLEDRFTVSSPNPFYNLYMGNTSDINPSINDLRRNATYESKLYNSEFFKPSFTYDSFTFVVQLEKCYLNYYINAYDKLDITFTSTKTINSRFMFTFNNYYLRNANESYAKYLPITRNNEEVLYNVPYINYIRNGFNYDVKSKYVNNASNVLGVLGSTATFAGALIAPTASLKVASVVAGVVSLAMSVKNTVVSAVNSELSIDRKLQEMKNQTASVSGSDDVDLMSEYTGNRLKCFYYEPTPVVKEMLFNLFFYAGYNSNRMGLPSHNTRLNFDYLEADVVIEKLTNALDNDIMEELINCFKNGITYIHKVENRTGLDKWDLEQKYENWERTIIAS